MSEYCAHCGTFVGADHFCATRKPANQAFLCVDLSTLREMLRFPKGITITAVRAALNSHQCVIEVAGPDLPADGELNATYTFEHHTIVKFKEFTKV